MENLVFGSTKIYGNEVFGYTSEENWKKNKNLNPEEVLGDEEFDLISDLFSPVCGESYGDCLCVRMLPGEIKETDNIKYEEEISKYLKEFLESDSIIYAFTRIDENVLVEFVTSSYWDKEKHLDGEYDKFLYSVLEDNLCKFDMGFDAENTFFLLGEANRTDQEIKEHIESFFEKLVYSEDLQKYIDENN